MGAGVMAATADFPQIVGRPANPGESEDEYGERIMNENYITESGCTPHGSME